MHVITEWEASRSGAGITVAMTDGGGVRHKQFVKKIESRDGTVVAIGGDGARFPLSAGRETSPEVAAIAGKLINLDVADLDTLDCGKGSLAADDLLTKIRKVAASALGQAVVA